jgi:hypothetical protein
MARMWLRGELVGEPDPPIDFVAWLKGEIDQAKRIIGPRNITVSPELWGVRARLQALTEVLDTHQRRATND